MDTHNTLTKQDEIELLLFEIEVKQKRLVELGVSLAEPRATLSVPIPTPTAPGISTAIVDATLAHTPGPWATEVTPGQALKYDKRRRTLATCEIYSMVECVPNSTRFSSDDVESPNWRTIVELHYDDQGNRAAQHLANARLLAAAPDLLFALDGLAKVIQKAGLNNLANGVELGATSWFMKASDAMSMASAAVAKATSNS